MICFRDNRLESLTLHICTTLLAIPSMCPRIFHRSCRRWYTYACDKPSRPFAIHMLLLRLAFLSTVHQAYIKHLKSNALLTIIYTTPRSDMCNYQPFGCYNRTTSIFSHAFHRHFVFTNVSVFLLRQVKILM